MQNVGRIGNPSRMRTIAGRPKDRAAQSLDPKFVTFVNPQPDKDRSTGRLLNSIQNELEISTRPVRWPADSALPVPSVPAGEVDWNSLLPDVWIAAHPEHFLHYRRDEAEVAAQSRRRRRADGREKARQPSSNS
jgi:hypothetical protein